MIARPEYPIILSQLVRGRWAGRWEMNYVHSNCMRSYIIACGTGWQSVRLLEFYLFRPSGFRNFLDKRNLVPFFQNFQFYGLSFRCVHRNLSFKLIFLIFRTHH